MHRHMGKYHKLVCNTRDFTARNNSIEDNLKESASMNTGDLDNKVHWLFRMLLTDPIS